MYHHRRNQDLVHHLCVLSTSTLTHILYIRSHALEQRNHLIKRLLISTNHYRQLPVTSANITSRNYILSIPIITTRSIQCGNSLALSHRVDLTRQRRLAGGHIHKDSALLQTVYNSFLTQHYLAHIFRISMMKQWYNLYPTMLNTTSHSFATSIGLFTTLAPFLARSSHLLKVRLY